MEILSVFSIADLLAYLFPGMLSLSGIYLILLLTPFRQLLQPPQDIGTSLAFLLISYITGVLLSSITDIVFREHPKSVRRKRNKGNIQIHDEKLKAEIMLAFNNLFFDQKVTTAKNIEQVPNAQEWNESHYYVCRSLVTEMMPRAGASGIREGAYRQLRMNLIGSILIWGVVGVIWGLILLIQPDTSSQLIGSSVIIEPGWALVLTLFSIIVPGYLITKLRLLMDKHEQREVREILTSFLAGYKAGIFDKRNK